MHDPADLACCAGIEKMRRRIEAESGPIDIIVANTCGSPVKPGPLRRPARKAGASVDGNLAATFLTLKSVLPGMKERGTGCVITMSSAAARRPHLGSPIAYAAAKGGDATPHQRRRRAGWPVRYPGSTASPQMIFTEANQGLLPPAKQEELRQGASAASPRYPEDVARAADFLALADLAWITGRLRTRDHNEGSTAMEDMLRQLQDEVHVSPANAGSPGLRAFTGRDGWICTHQDSDFQQVRLEARDIELRVYGDAAIWWMYRMRDASIREKDH